MLHEKITLEPVDTCPFFVVGKRYWQDHSAAQGNNSLALTLICLHSTSFHKETWEATIEDLFALQAQDTKKTVVIQDVWAIDCPNHGESALLNKELMKKHQASCQTYAACVHRFLSAKNVVPGVDFSKRNLVGVGHSLGANSIILLQEIKPALDFKALIIVEPMVSALGRQHLDTLEARLVCAAHRRRDRWPTGKAAFESFQKLTWDPRIIQAYLDYGLSWDNVGKSYTLSCPKEQEILMYLDKSGPTAPVDALNRISQSLPVHVILGEIGDLIPLYVQQELVNPAAGRRYASVRYIPKVGHLIPQESPPQLAVCLREALILISGRSSRL